MAYRLPQIVSRRKPKYVLAHSDNMIEPWLSPTGEEEGGTPSKTFATPSPQKKPSLVQNNGKIA